MTRHSRGCVLFVSPGPNISTPASGHGARLKHLSEGLADRWDVLALVPHEPVSSDADWVDEWHTYDQWSLPFLTDLNPSFVAAMGRVLRENDVDIVHLSIGVCATNAVATALGCDPTIVYAAQNVEAEHARDFVAETLPPHKRILGPRLIPWIERATVGCADALTAVSEADREAFVDRYSVDEERTATIPTGTQAVDTAGFPAPTEIRQQYGLTAERVAVFHGSYAHPPNREAVTLIQESVAPTIRDRGVDVEFLLVGKGIPESASENVRSVGFVEDLFPVLNAADFAVVPIRHGGGTKTKMYDYVSLGLPIVTTSKGAEGIDLKNDVHALITTDVNEAFVNAAVTAATDAERRERMRANLRTLASDRSWGRSADQLDAFYAERVGGQ